MCAIHLKALVFTKKYHYNAFENDSFKHVKINFDNLGFSIIPQNLCHFLFIIWHCTFHYQPDKNLQYVDGVLQWINSLRPGDAYHIHDDENLNLNLLCIRELCCHKDMYVFAGLAPNHALNLLSIGVKFRGILFLFH